MKQKIHITYDAAYTKLSGDVTEKLKNHVAELLSWQNKNATYLASQKGFRIDTVECCFNKATNSFPTGLLPRVVDLLQLFGCELSFECKYKVFQPEPVPIPNWAYEHQREIVKTALAQYRCLIQSPTGSGSY